MELVVGNGAEHFRCSICTDLVKNAVTLRPCEHNFCEGQSCPRLYEYYFNFFVALYVSTLIGKFAESIYDQIDRFDRFFFYVLDAVF